MSNDQLEAAIAELTAQVKAQAEIQEHLTASNRALTEMLGHAITAMQNLADSLDDRPAPEPDQGDDIEF